MDGVDGVDEGSTICRALDERLEEVRKRLREIDRRLPTYRVIEKRYGEVQKRLREMVRRRVRPHGPDGEG
jgi:hypothetical protein